MFYPDTEAKLVQALHGHYRQQRLRILIGDEIGSESGLPAGRRLYEEMVQDRLNALLAARNTDLALIPAEQVEGLRAKCLSLWQGDALDVLEKAGRGLRQSSRAELAASTLFRDTPRDNLQASAIHKQLAVMRRAHLVSLCLDPLLERAAEQLGLKPHPRLARLCGMADGSPEAPLILETLMGRSSGAARDLALKLQASFAKGPALLVGFAADDRVLRWVLSQKAANAKPWLCAALLVKREEPSTSWAIERMLEYYGAQAIWVDSLVELEPVLRNVQYGVPKDGQAPAWLAKSIEWRHKGQRLPDDILFSEGWQAAATAALRSLVDQLDFCFAPRYEESLEATLLLPMRLKPGLRLSVMGSSRGDPKDSRAGAERFCLDLAWRREQGLSGLAFSTGMILNSADEPSGAGPERNFDDEARTRWYEAGFRQWRSILSIPVLDSEEWLPIGVIAITSNLAEPFWLRLSDVHREEMLAAARRTAKFLLNEAAGLKQLASHVATELRTGSETPGRSEIAGDVLQDVIQTLKPRPLANFSGYLCTASAKIRIAKDSEYPTEVRVCRTPQRGKHSVKVRIGPRADAAERVDFEASIIGDGFEFEPESARVTIGAKENAASVVFRCVRQPQRAGTYEFYIQLYQSARFVEALTCEAEVA